jgi:carbon-monoxide dehydrogenase large subunit
VPRSEDSRLLRGGGRYVSDLVVPGMLHGYVLRSPHAHAKIISIDTSRAKESPGVHLILTGDDWIASGFGDMAVALPQTRPDGSPMAKPPLPGLVKDRVRRVGDYVAFVVADSVNEAKDGAELIEVDYEPLSAVTDAVKALEPDAPQVWDEAPGNLCYLYQVGDRKATEAAFAKAPHVVSQTLVINRVIAAAMEPRGCIGDYNQADEHYTLHATTQLVHLFRSYLASVILKVPESKLRVIAPDVGGSFGMKVGMYSENILVLLASKLIGRPVKWMSDRSEAFLADGHGRDNVSRAEMALDRDGKFLGFRARTVANLGAYLPDGTAFSPIMNVGSLAGIYTIPAFDVEVRAVFTNVNPLKPYRGNGRPEAAYVIERMVDLAADKLGIDAVEIRRRNAIPPSAMPYKTALLFTYDCGEFEKVMDIALEMADVQGFAERKSEARKRGKLRGLGLSYTIERAADGGTEGAEVRFDRSGTVTVISGSVSQGQGHETVFKQMVADRFGIEPREIAYVAGDTDKVAYGHGTGGSRSAAIGGSALLTAVNKAEAKAKAIAAHLLEAAEADVEVVSGLFTIAGTDRKIGIKEVAKAAADPSKLPPGMEPGLVASAVFPAKAMNFPNGCHVVEVEVDEETGVVTVARYNVVDDVGTVLNPLLLKGQIHGGVAQGIGQVLMEDLTYDTASGQLLAASFMDYAMPRASDLTFLDVKSHPVPTKTNPLGVKGAGEAGNVGALPAVANAIVDALSHLGIVNIPMPATSERLWRLIRDAKPKSQ